MDESVEIRKQVVAMLMQGGDYNCNPKSLIANAQKIVEYIEYGQAETDVVGNPKPTREEGIKSHERLKNYSSASS